MTANERALLLAIAHEFGYRGMILRYTPLIPELTVTVEQEKKGVPTMNKNRQAFNNFGDWLKAHNVSIFTLPSLKTGEVFWILQQPTVEAVGKGATLAEALENAGLSGEFEDGPQDVGRKDREAL